MKKPKITYFICTTPRTGSELLCEYLRGTRIAGWPEEYFQETHFQFLFKQFEATNFTEYFPKLLAARTTNADVFAAKIMGGGYFDQTMARFRELPIFQDSPEIPPNEIMTDIFPGAKYVWLTRRNKVRQAISYSKAFQSNIWQTHVEAGRQHGREPRFNFEAMDNLVQRLILQETAWQEFFTSMDVIPYTVVYEDFAKRPIEETLQILDFLEIQISPEWKALDEFEPRPKKLANKKSDTWFEQYVEQKQNELNRLQEMFPDKINHTEYNGWLRQEHFAFLRKAEGEMQHTPEDITSVTPQKPEQSSLSDSIKNFINNLRQ
jgi:LPS sulfotransferase NodH